ncbi:hypothetical protein [Streptomyces sp. I05A-00742]|uniref:hypothetical protein n=1 Tax=Streptomyces sp. I05A-00742 TaxID=2732853 RepID=UPI0014899CFE|nr:hypothetical protein [Streptomyces sp. I05A-00742]
MIRTVDSPPAPASVPSPEDVVRLWPLSRRGSAGDRVVALLLAVDGPDALGYPLGTRNQRLLLVHRSLVGRPVEAHVLCPACGTDNEFVLPVEDVTGLPRAAADAVARLVVGDAEPAFRLPLLADLTAVAGRSPSDGLRALASRTCLDEPPLLGPDDLDRLVDAWEALDPAGSLRVGLSCAECGHTVAADADPADFVARDLDVLVDGLMREVDVIAGGYGWSEEAILALPTPRRRRYVELITGGRSPARRAAAVR